MLYLLSVGADFSTAENTIVVSDLHLSDAEPSHPMNPLWKRYKRRRHFVDRTFRDFLEYISSMAVGAVELVFAGDTFDFDSVMKLPKHLSASWLERRRGLAAEESKSRYKIEVILHDHVLWVEALRNFILRGHRIIFVIGNHDVELHWPSVQETIISRLRLPEELRANVRFCEWYFVSNKDTLIEHGNQYDAYCVAANPIHPLIKIGPKVVVRLPFGNLAGKFMLNGMGLMNPHVDSSFIKSSLREYFIFYYKYVIRTQPLLMWDWAWSAAVTLVYSVSEGLLPAMRDPLMVPTRVADIAAKANTAPMTALSLRELHVHPAAFSPMKMLRELWLDRLLFLVLILIGSIQFFGLLNIVSTVSIWWFLIPVAILIPVFLSYAQSVDSELEKTQIVSRQMTPYSAKIVGVNRVIHGHIHREAHTKIDGVEYLNTGTWSPAFKDIECTQPFGRKCFAWIRGDGSGGPRVASLMEWKGQGQVEVISREDNLIQ